MISATLIKFDEIPPNGRIYSKEVFERAFEKYCKENNIDYEIHGK